MQYNPNGWRNQSEQRLCKQGFTIQSVRCITCTRIFRSYIYDEGSRNKGSGNRVHVNAERVGTSERGGEFGRPAFKAWVDSLNTLGNMRLNAIGSGWVGSTCNLTRSHQVRVNEAIGSPKAGKEDKSSAYSLARLGIAIRSDTRYTLRRPGMSL